MSDRFLTGKITSAHGIRGEVKVFPITDDAKRFKKMKKCFLARSENDEGRLFEIESSRIDRGNVLLKFKGVDDRDEGEKLRGLFIFVGREDAVKLPEDRFFIVDLIGLNVTDDEKGPLGVVNDVYETGANSVLSVKRKGKKDLQIPFLKAVCYDVNLEGQKIRTKLPEGLYEIYEPGAGGRR